MVATNNEIRKKKYLPFPGHTDAISARYHSRHLPNPNVVRIEVLSPSARAQYLNQGIYANMQVFQQALMEQLLGDKESLKPFYGFFDPTQASQGIDFGITAEWKEQRERGFGEIAGIVKKAGGMIPVVGGAIQKGAAFAEDMSKQANDLVKKMGIDTSSTGACTMKDFTRAKFNFNKTIECKWYLPEQENMARLSIARLLKLTYLRNMNLDGKDITEELTKAASNLLSSPALDDVIDSVKNTVDGIKKTVKGSTVDKFADALGEGVGALGYLKEAVTKTASEIDDLTGGALSDAGNRVKDSLTPSADTVAVIKDVMKQIANGGIDAVVKLNTFFGGNLTISPFPVRLTMGHILDIEPVVITSVTFSASNEQFVSEDGTHIPLYITAKIGFDMWMIPDPKKGFIRWMGDDVFNGGAYLQSAKTGTTSGTTGTVSGNKKKGTK